MPKVIFNGKPGEEWLNTTGKVQWQFVANMANTCGACFQYHMAISTWWPIPIHHGCRCRQVMIQPNAQAAPFVSFRDILDNMEPDQQRAAIGASNYKLVKSGVVPWDEVVTQSRVRTLAEVVARNKLTVRTMVSNGVGSTWAERAFASVNTPEHLIVNAHRQELIDKLAGVGLTPDQIKQAFGERVAKNVGIAAGPLTVEGFESWKASRVGGDLTPIRTLAPGLFPILRLNDRAKAAIAPADQVKLKPLPEFGPSGAEVVGVENATDLADGIEAAGKILGRKVTAKDLASIAGAPDNAKVYVETVGVGGGDVMIIFEADGIQATRRLRLDKDGKPELHNAALWVRDHGKGIGAQILGRQIEQAEKFGIGHMKTRAVGNPELAALENDALVIGFKTWPKFGYDGPLTDEQRNALPEKFRDAKTIGELYRTKEGRDAWAKSGSEITLTFDLAPGSYSTRVWEAYRREKAKGDK